MSDFEFSCPHCQQSFEAPEDMLGELIECPSCRGSIQLPNLEPKPQLQPSLKKKIVMLKRPMPSASLSNTKPCPFCGESILTVAIKCKHCGSRLTSEPAPPIERSEAIGIIALIMPLCSAMLAWFWLSEMPMIHDPGSKLTLISIMTIIITSVLVAIEATTVGAGSMTDVNARGNRREGPVAWFFGCLLLWIVVFPMWMARRAMYGLRNYCFAAVLIGLFFAGVTGFMHYAIEETKSEIRQHFNDTQRELERAQRELENLFR